VASPETCWGRRLWGMTPLVPLGLYSGGVAIGYVLPVLWMTSCLYTMARRNGRPHSERECTSWQLSVTMVLPCAVSGLRTGLLLFRPAVRGSGVLRRACLSVCLSVCPRAYLKNGTSNLHRISSACCLRHYVTYFRFCR